MYPGTTEGLYSLGNIWGHFSFTIALFVGNFLIIKNMPKRNNYWIRFGCCIAGIIGLTFLMIYIRDEVFLHQLNMNIKWLSFVWVFQYLLMILFNFICYECDFWVALFAASVGYSLQHGSQRLYVLIGYIFFEGFINDLYLWVILLTSISALYYLGWYFFVFRKIDYESFNILSDNLIQLMISAIYLVLVSYLEDRLRYGYRADPSSMQSYYISYYTFVVIISVIFTMLEISLIRVRHSSYEKIKLEELLNEEKRRYDEEKANIEMLNIKYHDLKHFMDDLSIDKPESVKKELSNFVTQYSTMVKTGNEAIDAILTKKAFYCSQNKIDLSSMVDGARLSFIKDYELYSLFDNAVSNAIEAVKNCPPEKRVISITSEEKNAVICLTFKNYYTGELRFHNGLPLTSKNTDYHGYGFKSIRSLVNKCDGKMKISTDKDIFILEIFFSLHSKKEANLSQNN